MIIQRMKNKIKMKMSRRRRKPSHMVQNKAQRGRSKKRKRTIKPVAKIVLKMPLLLRLRRNRKRR